MRFDIDGTGEREYTASAYTLMVYEQEFGGSLISDFYGKIDLRDADGQMVTAEFVEGKLRAAMPEGAELPDTVAVLVHRAFPAYVNAVLDYTRERWEAALKALWAMRRTADESAGEKTPAYRDWLSSLGPVNMQDIASFVFTECQRGLFRAAS